MYYIIIRGPLGIGKSTISKELSEKLKAKYVPYDRIVDKHKLYKNQEEGYISQKSFLRANKIAIKKAKSIIKKKPVIFDGNFYWKSTLDDLISKLKYPRYVFTLKAPVKVCIDRDSKRKKTHGKDATRVVHKKSVSFKYGIPINTNNKTKKEVIEAILKKIK